MYKKYGGHTLMFFHEGLGQPNEPTKSITLMCDPLLQLYTWTF